MNLKQWILCVAVSAAALFAPEAALAAGGSVDRSYRGEKTLALRVGYAGYNKSAVAGLEFTYRFSRVFRLAPSADYVIRRHDTDALSIAVDAQFLVPFSADRMAFYTYIGPKFSSWNYHWGSHIDDTDVSSRRSRLGLDAGAGLEANITPTLRLGVSAGYTFMRYFYGFNAALSFSYRF